MNEPFQAVKITDRVYWVGAIDWTLREFHGYRTQRGSTYNAYIVLADQITLIDTVKAPFFEEMKSRIASVVDPAKIQYIVSNHSEMDHSGSLPKTIEWLKPEKVFASAMGQKALSTHFHLDPSIITPVKESEPLSLGNMTLHFTETRMLHWPDSMFSYLAEDELLFSQDGFGMHLAGEERFVDEVDSSIIDYETAKYYANIIMLYSPMVSKTLAKVAAQNRPIKIIAPDHGPVWRKPDDLAKIMKFYTRWANQEKSNKAVIVYDTMWGSTAKMAKVIADSLAENGIKKVSLFCMSASDRSDVVTEILEAGGLLVGSPTMNNQIFPTMADILCYIKGLKPKNLVGGVFGSFGWSGEAVKIIAEEMNEMKIELVSDPVNIQYVPDETGLKACRELSIKMAQRIRNNPIF